MALRLPHGTLVVVGLLLVLAATGCTRTDASTPLSTAAVDTPPAASRAPSADSLGMAEATPVDTGDDSRMYDLAVDRAGNPLVLIVDEQGGLSVNRPLERGGAGSSWNRRSLDDLSAWSGAGAIAAGPDGDVFVSGYDGQGLAVARIEPSGTVTISPVAGLPLATVTNATTALAPRGDVLYVAYVNSERAPRLQAVDTGTGALLVDTQLVSGIAGQIRPTGIAVSPSGDRVFVALQIDTADGSRTTATLQRLSGDLELRGEVPLVHGQVQSRTAQLVATDDGSAYATLVLGDVGAPGVEVRLVAAPAAAVTATPVASFADLDDVRSLAVDRSGEWAYLGGLANPPDPLALTVTPVDLRTGQSRTPIQLCSRGELADMVLLGDGDEAWVGGRCLDKGFASELWTLR